MLIECEKNLDFGYVRQIDLLANSTANVRKATCMNEAPDVKERPFPSDRRSVPDFPIQVLSDVSLVVVDRRQVRHVSEPHYDFGVRPIK